MRLYSMLSSCKLGRPLRPNVWSHIRAPETASASAASANTVDRTVRTIGIASAKQLGNFVHPAMGTLPASRCVDHPSSVDCMSLDLSSLSRVLILLRTDACKLSNLSMVKSASNARCKRFARPMALASLLTSPKWCPECEDDHGV